MPNVTKAYNFQAILEGALSFLPGGVWLLSRKGTGGTTSARYCYTVWLRHLIKTAPFRKGPPTGTVVELGPGDSLGIGLAALLSGAERYVAVDSVRYADTQRNIEVLEELVALFRQRAPVPDAREFPRVKPELQDYRFPDHLLPKAWLYKALDPGRIQRIESALRETQRTQSMVCYVDPQHKNTIPQGTVTHVFSQAVLEHVDEPNAVYTACHDWLAPDGVMSHVIDFKSHGVSKEWNGHWLYPDPLWRLIRGRRPYLLNRLPCSAHLDMIRAAGFALVSVERTHLPSSIETRQLARRFRRLSPGDLTTSGVFLVAQKPPMATRHLHQSACVESQAS